MAGREVVSARDEWESMLTDEGRHVVEGFMAEAASEDDDFDIDAVIAQNHRDTMRDWFGNNGLPARGDLR